MEDKVEVDRECGSRNLVRETKSASGMERRGSTNLILDTRGIRQCGSKNLAVGR
jgi:hypothetical protein